MSRFLVLWDVDFTLVNTRGVGFQLYQLAFAELYGRDLPAIAAKANMAGRTDRAIALEVLAISGIPDPPAEVERFEATLSKLAPNLATMVVERGVALPGAAAALAALAGLTDGERAESQLAEGQLAGRERAEDRLAGGERAESGLAGGRRVLQSVLTGNVRAMAEVKLRPFGLTAHLDLDVGAYGDESGVRADLVGLARERAFAAYQHDFSGQATVLVGDTPLDVEAALTTGARAVGVATGHSPATDLVAAGAHAVLPDLTNTAEVVAAILGPTTSTRDLAG